MQRTPTIHTLNAIFTVWIFFLVFGLWFHTIGQLLLNSRLLSDCSQSKLMRSIYMKKLFHRRCHNNFFFSLAICASATTFASDFSRFLSLLCMALHTVVSPLRRRNKNRIHSCCCCCGFFFFISGCLQQVSVSTTEALMFLPYHFVADSAEGMSMAAAYPLRVLRLCVACVSTQHGKCAHLVRWWVNDAGDAHKQISCPRPTRHRQRQWTGACVCVCVWNGNLEPKLKLTMQNKRWFGFDCARAHISTS